MVFLKRWAIGTCAALLGMVAMAGVIGLLVVVCFLILGLSSVVGEIIGVVLVVAVVMGLFMATDGTIKWDEVKAKE
ncbi:hypothetical protein NGI46_07995 [Peribacillus butanolivorans]|uniref:hypothetical protein n=1 Tax=Peribacillus butanolivorans TaxID=421767 RepID=UPI00207C7984|nr:hypothetical protein [Peribacillus butanolivorans]MCO0597408.1 hypothetical protein [Peribacillus butanolivorans]